MGARQADDVVISAQRLKEEFESGAPLVLLEIGRDPADDAWASKGHIPGAHYVSVQPQLAGRPYPGSGNNPLPKEADIQAEITRWGITNDSRVITYARDTPALAARGWWTLTWAGVPSVRVLDGGLDAWTAAGGQLSTEPAVEGGGTFTVRTGSLPVLDTPEAAALARSGRLFDGRAEDAYAAGHIPGAISVPGTGVTDGGLLRPDEELRALYADATVSADDGTADVGAYCNGGTAASLEVLALAKLGITAALYPGSWSAWSSDPTRPSATGSEPG